MKLPGTETLWSLLFCNYLDSHKFKKWCFEAVKNENVQLHWSKSFQTRSIPSCLLCNEFDTTDQNETVTLAINKKKTPKHLCSVCVLKVNCLGILVGLRMLKLRIHRAQRWKGKWYNQDPVFLICNSSWWAYVGNQLWLKASRIRLYLPCSLGPSRPVLLTAKPQPHISI